MKKFYLKNGKEVHIGDVITHCTEEVDPIYGNVKTTMVISVNDFNLKELIKAGIISVSEDKSSIPLTTDYYINKIASRMGWTEDKMEEFILNLYKVYPSAAFNTILREIAIELDKKYDDHIKYSPEIFAVSSLNGIITKVNKAPISNYRNFAAFRSIEDAKIACRILKKMLKELYAKE